jgi:hypothetical protein
VSEKRKEQEQECVMVLRQMLYGVVVASMLGGVGRWCSAATQTNLDELQVYPNPFQIDKGHTQVSFDRLTADADIRIYKITGELVTRMTSSVTDGKILWDITNSEGDAVAPGVYVYVVTNAAGQKKNGKLAIIK